MNRKPWDDVEFSAIVQDGAFGPRFSGNSYAEDGNIATLRTTDMSADGTISYNTMPLARLDESKFANHFLERGDIVISRSGRIGTTAFFETHPIPVLPGAFLLRFRLTDVASPRFYTYWFNSPVGQQRIMSVARGAAQQNINLTNVLRLKVPLPPMTAQEGITQILSAYDDLIENNRRRIQLLEAAARLLYKEWFVHLRFPGHEHVKITDGVPEAWTEPSLGDVMNLKRGYDLPNRLREPGVVPIVSSSGISGFHNVAKVKAPGVVTGRYGTLGSVYLVHQDFWPLNTSLYVQDFKGNDRVFAFHFLTQVLQGTQSDKAAVPGVNRNDLHRVRALLPPKQLQHVYAGTVTPMHDQVATLELQNEKLSEARDLLLPRLMNGEIPV